MLSASALKWLESRGLDAELASKLGLETVSRGAGEWIALPYVREGKIVNRKYRRIDEKAHSQDPNSVKCVWNEDVLRDKTLTGPVLITEGEWDAMAAIQCGFLKTVSVPDGAPQTAIGDDDSAKYSYLPDLIELLKDETEIIIAADGDPQGANLLSDLSVRLGKARCKFLKYPKECKDLGDALRTYGEKGVLKTLERAEFIEISGVFKLSELPPEPQMVVYRVPLSPEFEKHVGIVKGHFSVWTGVPNHGKSALVNAVAIEMALNHGWTIAMSIHEGSPRGSFQRDVTRYLAGRAWNDLEPQHHRNAEEFIEKHFVFIVPKMTDELTLDWLLEKSEAAIVRNGANMVVLDPWNQLDHEFGPDSETIYTSRCIKILQRMSRRYNVHTAIIAHPKKIEWGTSGPRVPMGYDIAGSANWFNHPELGVTVHRADKEKGPNCTLVRVWKSKRHDEMGPCGDVHLRFSTASGRYEQWFDPYNEAAA